MAELDGKVALVTGGTAGIGLATARLLAARGARLAVCGTDGLNQTLAVLPDAIGAELDVRDEGAVAAWVERAHETFGRVDVLVCSAGVQRYGTVEETTAEAWDEVLDINLKGAFLAARQALPRMRAQGNGSVVLVSSVQAFASQASVAAYTVSKAGLNALARSIAVDYAAAGIRANAVCPASVDTPMLRWAAGLTGAPVDDTVQSWGRTHPLGRVADPHEVAEVIAFLASDRSSFVTGSEYRVDGGVLAVNPASPLQ